MDYAARERMFQIEKDFEYNKWTKEIPSLPMKSNWVMRPLPPFAGAVVRFSIAHKKTPTKQISVYLDCYENLGYFGEPHWEIYPGPSGENDRFAMNDVETLVAAIDKALKRYSK